MEGGGSLSSVSLLPDSRPSLGYSTLGYSTLGGPLCCTQMLLFLTLWALVPCLVLLTLYFLSSTGGKSGGNKKNDGVKVSPREPAGLSLAETCCQALGKFWLH